MRAAIKDGGISPSEIDYVNLHGTGTIDNDLSEARALDRLFAEDKPLLSSVKGAFGHSLAAAGAIEAVISAMGISDSFVPGNAGCNTPDPELRLNPVIEPIERDIQTVLSNSFGFGGNNASVLIGRPEEERASISPKGTPHLAVVGCACITGAGKTRMTEKTVSEGRSCKGELSEKEVSKDLSPKTVRRIKRLSRLALSLATAAHKDSGESDDPNSLFFGTGWGPLSDTYDFLTKLYESEEHFTSPTDFIGSVHNAPAGLIAIRFRATGPNITTTGGDYSFEQSLITASLLTKGQDDLILVVGADESHEVLSGLFDDSVSGDQTPSDGGGALCLRRADTSTLFAGIPGSYRERGRNQLSQFLAGSGFEGPVIDYRRLTGEFASASAVAAVLAVCFARKGKIPEALCGRKSSSLNGKGILIIGLGKFVTAVELIT
jgi:3-oxoacyl-[acyl-carrier-protein] synthase-1/3-oxoacyl-[acyl-carrier-protein] synthase II